MSTDVEDSYYVKIIKSFLEDPWSLVTSLAIVLIPLLIVSALMSYKLAKKFEHNAKKERAHQKLIDTVKASANGTPTSSKSTRRGRAKRE